MLRKSHGRNSAPLKIHETRSPSRTNTHKPFVYPISGLKFIIHLLYSSAFKGALYLSADFGSCRTLELLDGPRYLLYLCVQRGQIRELNEDGRVVWLCWLCLYVADGSIKQALRSLYELSIDQIPVII